MDIARSFTSQHDAITCVDLHTTGEPTRIVISGYPDLTGTLLEQRAEAKHSHDHIRRQLLLEPRGHSDMYGAILRQNTEQTASGDAHIGVLFATNSGYSTMCGHATIALGRVLLDTHDKAVFSNRDKVAFDAETKTASLTLHAPCGLVHVTVPTNSNGTASDPTRPVSHISVPSFTTGINIKVFLKAPYRWPELCGRHHVTADFSYGGAFYCFITAAELGFPDGLSSPVDIDAMNVATRNLKAAINENSEMKHLFSHPDHNDLGFLYSIIVADKDAGVPIAQSTRAETGLCFFSDQQVDRSPTGSGVAARIALAQARGELTKDESITYHSLLSNSLGGRGGFVGSLHEVVGMQGAFPVVRARVEGYASYTGTSTFVVEKDDALGQDGFLFDRLE
ncbi:Trans-L-3-hydroxyproline dehydratase [Fulvia fulva]|nr:Trans-L-3-hydroxyproline dehydratase [Fulvia fulva]WPV14557.1 Trans-L-3-hydroxyproline dehydratase [Fulvia fulva]WPV29898.1 Trans-L-3-hydroxyproline dehydratase [Fulvia fulva]